MSAKEFNKDIDARNDPVREKLLDAAEKLFAEKGFNGTSVRDITTEAKCNVAAVNYHFGGKDNLYTETFRRKLTLLRDVRVTRIDEVMARGGETTLEDLLRAFGKAFFEPLVGVSSGPRFIKLWLREMLDQRLPATMFVEETFRPVLGSLQQALMKVCPGLGEAKAMSAAHAVVGQLAHLLQMHEFWAQGHDSPKFDLDGPLEQVVEFSAAGIRGFAKGSK
jgi:AcrR family transcriptional regulator